MTIENTPSSETNDVESLEELTASPIATIDVNELSNLVQTLVANPTKIGQFEEASQYKAFVTELGELIADHCGGQVETKSLGSSLLVDVYDNASLPDASDSLWTSMRTKANPGEVLIERKYTFEGTVDAVAHYSIPKALFEAELEECDGDVKAAYQVLSHEAQRVSSSETITSENDVCFEDFSLDS